MILTFVKNCQWQQILIDQNRSEIFEESITAHFSQVDGFSLQLYYQPNSFEIFDEAQFVTEFRFAERHIIPRLSEALHLTK